MKRWYKAASAVLESTLKLNEEQKFMLLNQADLLDNRETALVGEAKALAERFVREANKVARGERPHGFRADKAVELEKDYAVFEMHAQCFRAAFRLVGGGDLLAALDKELSK